VPLAAHEHFDGALGHERTAQSRELTWVLTAREPFVLRHCAALEVSF
jgi:hypothetical protein